MKRAGFKYCAYAWRVLDACQYNLLYLGWKRSWVLAREHVSLLHVANRSQELLQSRCHGWASGQTIKLVSAMALLIWADFDSDFQAFVETGGEAELDVYRAVLRLPGFTYPFCTQILTRNPKLHITTNLHVSFMFISTSVSKPISVSIFLSQTLNGQIILRTNLI